MNYVYASFSSDILILIDFWAKHFSIINLFNELELGMIYTRRKAEIIKAKSSVVKFGRTIGSKNKKTEDNIEKYIFFRGEKSSDWITIELCVIKKNSCY